MLTRADQSRSTRQRTYRVRLRRRSVSSAMVWDQSRNYFKASSSACTTTERGGLKRRDEETARQDLLYENDQQSS